MDQHHFKLAWNLLYRPTRLFIMALILLNFVGCSINNKIKGSIGSSTDSETSPTPTPAPDDEDLADFQVKPLEQVYAVAEDSSGRRILGGGFEYVGLINKNQIRLNADGTRDTSFSTGSGFDNMVMTTALQSDGKIVAGGDFSSFDGTEQKYMTRLNADGSRDTSFTVGSKFNGRVSSIAIQSDGKIVAGGSFSLFDGAVQNFIIRLNSDGTKDTSFNIGTGFNGTVHSVALQSDGKILVVGSFNAINGTTQNRITRLNSDGSRDTSFTIGTGFNNTAYSLAIQSDGKILVGGGGFSSFNGTAQNGITRLNADGTRDTSFTIGSGFDAFVEKITVQSDGKILVGGWFTSYDGTAQNYITRLNADGTRDTSFNIGSGTNGYVFAIQVQSDGKILIGGQFSNFNGTEQLGMTRLNADGTRDTSFISGLDGTVRTFIVQSNAKILAGGGFLSYNRTSQNRITRYSTDGSLDTSFNIGSGFDGGVMVLAVQSDDKILVGGWFSSFNGTAQNYITRLNSDGTRDTSFNIGSGFDGGVSKIVVQSDGKIVVAGGFSDFNGTTQNYITRLNADGSRDTSFNIGSGFDDEVLGLAVQSDGKILVSGYFTDFNGAALSYFTRLNSDGTRDTSFNIGTGLDDAIYAFAIQSDGKILAGGDFSDVNGTAQFGMTRLNTDGSVDGSFNVGSGFNQTVTSLVLQSDGKILAGGEFSSFDGTAQNRITRLNADGSRDTSFNIGTGFDNAVKAMLLQSDGDLLVGGSFTTYNSESFYKAGMIALP